jgi:hypothetical protein
LKEGVLPVDPCKKKKSKDRKQPITIEGTQEQFCQYLAITIEKYLPHSIGCRVTDVVLKRRLEKRPDNVIAVDTDFSADLEMRPRDAGTCQFYVNVSVIPFYIHYTDAAGKRCTDCLIVCAEYLGKDFVIYQKYLLEIMKQKAKDLEDVRETAGFWVITDNCRKQYRNRNNYGCVCSQ